MKTRELRQSSQVDTQIIQTLIQSSQFKRMESQSMADRCLDMEVLTCLRVEMMLHMSVCPQDLMLQFKLTDLVSFQMVSSITIILECTARAMSN